MNTTEIDLIKSYIQQGVRVHLSVGDLGTNGKPLSSFQVLLNRITYEGPTPRTKTPWGKTNQGDFNLKNVTTNAIFIEVGNRKLRMFNDERVSLITQGPVNKYTIPHLLYKVEHFKDIRIGSNSGEGRVINKGIYAEMLKLLDGCPTKVKDLCLAKIPQGDKPEDLLFEVVVVETYPRVYWIIDTTELEHYGFQVTELI